MQSQNFFIYSSVPTDFLEVQIVIIEEIKTDQDRKDSLKGLKDFLAVRTFSNCLIYHLL